MTKLFVGAGALALAVVLTCLLPLQILPDATASVGLRVLFFGRNLLALSLLGAAAAAYLSALANGVLRGLAVLGVVVGISLLCSTAFAQTVVTAPSTVDLSSLVNQVLEAAVLALGAVIGWIVKRGVVALESLNVLQTNSVHGSSIDNAVASAVSFVESKLEALVDPHVRLSMQNSVLSEAAQLVATTAPNAIAALGLTPASIQAKIQLALGDPLAAADVPAATTVVVTGAAPAAAS